MINKIKKSVSKLNIFQKKKSNINVFNESSMQNNANQINQYFSDPKVVINELISNGRLDLAADAFKQIHTLMANAHPLAPDYLFAINEFGGKIFLTSTPFDNKIAETKPLKYTGKLTIIDENYSSDVDIGKFILQQSFRNNPIKVKISSFAEIINGEIIDNPLSFFNVMGENIETSISPQERKSILAKMTIGEIDDLKNVIDYLELQFTDYDIENEVLLISNIHQENAIFNIEIKIPIELMRSKGEMVEVRNVGYQLNLHEIYSNTVHGEILFVELLKSLQNAKSISLHDLQMGNTIFTAYHNITDEVQNDKEVLDKQLKLLEMLKKVEDDYQVKFALSMEEIDAQDIEIINLLDTAINNKELEYSVNEFSALVNYKDSISNIIDTLEKNEESIFSIESNQTINAKLWNVDLEFVTFERYEMLKIRDLERLKARLQLLEEGETLKIQFQTQSDTKCYKKIELVNSSIV